MRKARKNSTTPANLAQLQKLVVALCDRKSCRTGAFRALGPLLRAFKKIELELRNNESLLTQLDDNPPNALNLKNCMFREFVDKIAKEISVQGCREFTPYQGTGELVLNDSIGAMTVDVVYSYTLQKQQLLVTRRE